MADFNSIKRLVVHNAQRYLVNPVGRRLPVVMLETTGRTSGRPRHTAIGGRLVGNQFWLVRLQQLPTANSAVVRAVGTELLSIRVGLD